METGGRQDGVSLESTCKQRKQRPTGSETDAEAATRLALGDREEEGYSQITLVYSF